MPAPSELARGTIEPILFALLAERPMYGYDIVRTVDARSNGVLKWKEGTLYPLLHRLEGQKLIAAKWQDGDAGKPRKYYRLTPKGRRKLDASRAEWETLRGAVDAFLIRTA